MCIVDSLVAYRPVEGSSWQQWLSDDIRMFFGSRTAVRNPLFLVCLGMSSAHVLRLVEFSERSHRDGLSFTVTCMWLFLYWLLAELPFCPYRRVPWYTFATGYPMVVMLNGNDIIHLEPGVSIVDEIAEGIADQLYPLALLERPVFIVTVAFPTVLFLSFMFVVVAVSIFVCFSLGMCSGIRRVVAHLEFLVLAGRRVRPLL